MHDEKLFDCKYLCSASVKPTKLQSAKGNY